MKNRLKNYNKPKILMIGPYPPPYGGISVVVRDLINSPLNDTFNLRLLKTTTQKQNLKHIYLEEFRRVTKDKITLLKEHIFFKPHIVHIHTSYDEGWPKLVSYAIISKIFGSQVILHMHAYHKDCKGEFPKIWLKRYIFPPKFVFQLVDYLFTLSDTYTQNIQNHTKTPVTTIPNGILLKKFIEEEKSKEKNDFVVSYIGTIRKRKGIYEMMKAISELVEEFPDIKFNIAGDGAAKEDVVNWITTLHSKNVHYLGIVDEEKVKLLHNTDIFLLPSYSEGLPISILEAIAGGCAIITTPVGAIPDVIKDGENAIFIPPQDAKAIKNAIIQLYKDKTLLEKIQKNNLQKRNNYSWEEITKEISQVYLKMYKDKKGK